MSRTRYTAECERDPDSNYWVVSVPELEGVFTQGRTLRECARLARDAIALWLDVETDAFDVQIVPCVNGEPMAEVALALAAKVEKERVMNAWSTASSAAVQRLEDLGATRRDIAEVLGITHQRVDQIAHNPTYLPGMTILGLTKGSFVVAQSRSGEEKEHTWDRWLSLPSGPAVLLDHHLVPTQHDLAESPFSGITDPEEAEVEETGT